MIGFVILVGIICLVILFALVIQVGRWTDKDDVISIGALLQFVVTPIICAVSILALWVLYPLDWLFGLNWEMPIGSTLGYSAGFVLLGIILVIFPGLSTSRSRV